MRAKPNNEPGPRGRSETLLVRGARQLLTLRGTKGPRRGAEMAELRIIVDGALLIKNGVIAEVGPSRRVERLAEARKAIEIDASGKVVLPGFVDAGTSLISPPVALDDYEIRCRTGKMAETVLPSAAAIKAMRGFSAQWMELEAGRRLRHFWRHGTTTLDASSGFGLDDACEMRTLRVLGGLTERPLAIVRTYGGADMVAPEYAGRAQDYLDWMMEAMLPGIRRRRLAEFVSIRIGPTAFTMEQAKRFLGVAAELGFGARVVMDGATSQGALPCLAVAINSKTAEPAARHVTGGFAAVVIVSPARDFHAGLPPGDARTLVDQGAAVALASGFGAPAGPTPSMPAVMSLACVQNGLSPAEAVAAATINSACALGVDDRAGSLEAGKNADLLLMQTGDYRDIPLCLGLNLIAGVMRRGEMIFPRLEPA